MKPWLIILVCISALGHAYWNYLFKKIVNKSKNKLVIFWLCTFVGCILFLPLFIFYFERDLLSFNILIYPALFGFFLACYMLLLTKSYSYHDLSLAYPLSKITPCFTLLFGLFILKEKVSMLAFIGILCIIFGAYAVHLKNFSFKNFVKPLISLKSKGSMFALFTAVASAFYGLISKMALNTINPISFVYLGYLFSIVFYSSIFLFNKQFFKDIKDQFKKYKKWIIRIGILDIFGYFLILIVLMRNKLSYIFALRQMSIIFVVFFGSKMLNEKNRTTRLISSIIIIIGILLISVSS
jgi:uncharacterized membrane protein